MLNSEDQLRLTDDLLIACALKKEAEGLRVHLRKGYWIEATGLGTDRTLKSLDRIFTNRRPSCLIFTGMAGQLDPSLDLGQVVLPELWKLESGTCFSVRPQLVVELRRHGWEIGGAGVTVRAPVVRRQARIALMTSSGARICDMESSAAMMVAGSYRIPVLAPKLISDTSDSGMLAFYRLFNRNVETLSAYLKGLIETLDKIPAQQFY